MLYLDSPATIPFNSYAGDSRPVPYDTDKIETVFTGLFNIGSEADKTRYTENLFRQVTGYLAPLTILGAGEVWGGTTQNIVGRQLDILTSPEVGPYLPANAPRVLSSIGILATQRVAELVNGDDQDFAVHGHIRELKYLAKTAADYAAKAAKVLGPKAKTTADLVIQRPRLET